MSTNYRSACSIEHCDKSWVANPGRDKNIPRGTVINLDKALTEAISWSMGLLLGFELGFEGSVPRGTLGGIYALWLLGERTRVDSNAARLGARCSYLESPKPDTRVGDRHRLLIPPRRGLSVVFHVEHIDFWVIGRPTQVNEPFICSSWEATKCLNHPTGYSGCHS
jgi:hypothetical protein